MLLEADAHDRARARFQRRRFLEVPADFALRPRPRSGPDVLARVARAPVAPALAARVLFSRALAAPVLPAVVPRPPRRSEPASRVPAVRILRAPGALIPRERDARIPHAPDVPPRRVRDVAIRLVLV